MTLRNSIRETDLYAPLRDYLTAQGYTVRAEVKGCDVTATKGDALIVVELKRNMTLTLLAQAALRQRVADSVYVAVPRPSGGAAGRAWKGIRHLLRRLELGLILVSLGSKAPRVEIVFHPGPFARRKQKNVRRALLEEMAGRSGDFNEGGSTRRKLVTAYRESAIQIACCLDALGPTSPRDLRARGCCEKTASILYDNVYGWFERQGRGIYGLSTKGRKELKSYPELVRAYRLKESGPSG
ncbi:MAG: hypothetical protein IT364_19645 [Candidatus Hydrogenedentes bacterium]|nr:hypothetical protein [Candidatus Hydrogenedentota bacterium]